MKSFLVKFSKEGQESVDLIGKKEAKVLIKYISKMKKAFICGGFSYKNGKDFLKHLSLFKISKKDAKKMKELFPTKFEFLPFKGLTKDQIKVFVENNGDIENCKYFEVFNNYSNPTLDFETAKKMFLVFNQLKNMDEVMVIPEQEENNEETFKFEELVYELENNILDKITYVSEEYKEKFNGDIGDYISVSTELMNNNVFADLDINIDNFEDISFIPQNMNIAWLVYIYIELENTLRKVEETERDQLLLEIFEVLVNEDSNEECLGLETNSEEYYLLKKWVPLLAKRGYEEESLFKFNAFFDLECSLNLLELKESSSIIRGSNDSEYVCPVLKEFLKNNEE